MVIRSAASRSDPSTGSGSTNQASTGVPVTVAKLPLQLNWLAAPDRAYGEEAAWNPRPADNRVSVVAHHAPDCPADKLLGRIKCPPIGKPKGLELGCKERDQCCDCRKAFSRESTVFRV